MDFADIVAGTLVEHSSVHTAAVSAHIAVVASPVVALTWAAVSVVLFPLCGRFLLCS